jgi:HEAT repeat protein
MLDGKEEALAALLIDRHEDLRVVAAECLWETHSRRHARKVFELVDDLHAQSDAARRLKETVEGELRTLAESGPRADDDPAWWAWLAALRPNPAMLPALEELALRKPPLPEAIYALGQSKDARALGPLLKVLSTGDDRIGGYAAEALGELGNPDAEPELTKALQRDGQFLRANACKALGKIGADRALPELRRLAADKGYQGAINVTGCARRAIAAIEARTAKAAGRN